MSFAVLFVMVMAALVAGVALPRGLSRGVAWVGAVVLLLLFILAGLGMRVSYRSAHTQAEASRQYAMQVQYAEMATHGQATPGWTGYPPLTRLESGNSMRATGIVVFALLIGLPLLVLAIVRRHWPASNGRPVAGVMVAVLGVIVFGLYFVRSAHQSSQVAIIEPPVYYQDGHAIPIAQQPIPQAEPLDELWDKLNQPRIQLFQLSAAVAEPHEESGDQPTERTADSDHGHDAGEAAHEPDHGAESAAAEIDHATAHAASVDPEATHAHATAAEAEDHPAPAATPAASVAAAEPAPKPKPPWVVNPPEFVGDGVTRLVVQAGPYSTLKECYDNLRRETREAVRQRIEQLVRDATGNSYVYVPDLEQMRLGNSFIDRELLTEQYVETVEASFGLTKTAWGLLEFTQTRDEQLVDAWKRYARRDGIAGAIVASGLVLSVLGGIFALLKVDTWTRGYYTKRLFLGVPAAIIGVIVLIAAMS